MSAAITCVDFTSISSGVICDKDGRFTLVIWIQHRELLSNKKCDENAGLARATCLQRLQTWSTLSHPSFVPWYFVGGRCGGSSTDKIEKTYARSSNGRRETGAMLYRRQWMVLIAGRKEASSSSRTLRISRLFADARAIMLNLVSRAKLQYSAALLGTISLCELLAEKDTRMTLQVLLPSTECSLCARSAEWCCTERLSVGQGIT